MSHKILRPFIVKVAVLGYFPLYITIVYYKSIINNIDNCKLKIMINIYFIYNIVYTIYIY